MITARPFSIFKTLVPLILVFLLNGSTVLAQVVTTVRGDGHASLFGVVSEDKYTNEFFGFSLPIPTGFSVIEREQSNVLAKAGLDMLKGDNAAKSKALDTSLAAQATVFGIAEKPLGSPGNSVLEVVVLKQAPGVTADMALAASVSLATSTGKLKLLRSLPSQRYGGMQFSGAVLGGEFNSVKLNQEMYIIIRRGYSVHFCLTYSTDEGRKSVMGILEKVRFTK